MSYEGRIQILCKNGHYSEIDCYMYSKETFVCDTCGENEHESNSVDDTNGYCDGYKDVIIKSEEKCPTCGATTEQICEFFEEHDALDIDFSLYK